MSLWYFTFGQKYRHEPHPQGGHPDGWFTVEAENWGEARDKMLAACGQQWSMQYDQEPDRKLFHRGELRRL